ncbi:MAG TPA: ABC transporter substrate-binding protein [Chloroflexota bacterium]
MRVRRHAPLSCILLIGAALAACAPATTPNAPSAAQPTAQAPSRTLVMVTRAEPSTLSGTLLLSLGIGATANRRPFNAALAILDSNLEPRPYLAERLPELNSGDWQVFPDGRMETTYRLKPNLTWHDGSPLTAADFVFAWRIYTTPEFGTSTSPPHTHMQEVLAQDDRTLHIRWSKPYPEAGALTGLGGAGASPSFDPLPRHLLEPPYQQDPKSFPNLSFFTVDFVGAGPYRLDRWESGSFIEGAAFDGHALGRPKIDRLRIIFNSDQNTTLAVMLSGEAHLPMDDSLGIEQGNALKQDWDARQAGTVRYLPSTARYVRVQFRPEYVKPRALLDVRFRRALAYTMDKKSINEVLFDGNAQMSDSLIPPEVVRKTGVDTSIIPVYRFDPRQAEQLMQQGGYTKDRDGFYANSTEGRINVEIKNITNPRNDSERATIANGWRQSGIEIDETNFLPQQARDNQALSTFRSLSPTGGVPDVGRFLYFLSSELSSPDTQWVGSNRGGWSNPDYNHNVELFNVTLDARQRGQYLVQAARIINEDLGVIPLYYAPTVLAYPVALRGIDTVNSTDNALWNINDWVLE